MRSARLPARLGRSIAVLMIAMSSAWPAGAYTQQPCSGVETWTKVGKNTWRAHGLPRSQGATAVGHGWIFSWQGGVSRTDEAYNVRAINTWPPQLLNPLFNPTGPNHFGPTHIGDVDVHNGILYAPEEDGGEDLGPLSINNPEFQHPIIALYEAKTLRYTGVSYELPTSLNADGVPWIAINSRTHEAYTAEWGMPHDRINVFDLQMNFLRFIDLHYPASLGAGFHLSRIQGAEVFGGALYAARDDDGKSVFKIDIATGNVSKAFALNPAFPSEMEGIAVRATPDGALFHVLLVVHKDLPLVGEEPVAIQFQHFALSCS